MCLEKIQFKGCYEFKGENWFFFFSCSKGYFLFLLFLDDFCTHILDIEDWVTEAHTVSALRFPESLEEYHPFKTIWFINFITQNLVETSNCFSLKIKCEIINFNHVSLLTTSNFIILLHFFPAQELSWLFILYNSMIPNVKVSHAIFQLELDFLLNNVLFEIFFLTFVHVTSVSLIFPRFYLYTLFVACILI